MGRLVLAAIVPHPPIMVQAVGGKEIGRVRETRESMEEIAEELHKSQPDTLVVITPHGAVFSDAITMPAVDSLTGDLSRFGAPEVQIEYKRDKELGDLLDKNCRKREIPFAQLSETMARQHGVSLELDHGIVAPFSFFGQLDPKPLLLPINMGLIPREELYAFGMALQKAIRQSGKQVGVIASSDLSHRVTLTAPGGYSPQGEVFDNLLKGLLEEFDVPRIMAIPEELQEEAGECGYRPILMLLGSLDGYEIKGEVLSYEAPFGVGYLVARFLPQDNPGRESLWTKLLQGRRSRTADRIKNEGPVVRLARQSLENFYSGRDEFGGTLPELPKDLPPKAGAFVTLKKDGHLRGCIGTTVPTQPSLVEEIMANAIKAATEDPRFPQVRQAELDELTISVDILGEPEAISGPEDLEPQKYGVIVRKGFRSGLLLPALEGIDSAEEQINIAKEKAGIGPHEPVKLERFLVTRFE